MSETNHLEGTLDESRGHHRYVAALKLNLCELVLSCRSTKIRYLHVYADEVAWILPDRGARAFPDGTQELMSLPGLKSGMVLRYVHVYARSLFEAYTTEDFQEKKSSNIDFLWSLASNNGKHDNIRLVIFYQQCDPQLRVGHLSSFYQSTVVPVVRSCDSLHAGISLRPVPPTETGFDHSTLDPKASNSTTRLDNIPSSELVSETNQASIGHALDGKALPKKSYLTILLRRIFLEASQDIFGDSKARDRAISRLQFVLLCTRASGTRTTLADAASAILTRLQRPSIVAIPALSEKATMSFDVPVLNMDKYMNMLAAYIDLVQDVETKLTEATKAAREKVTQKQQTFLLIDAMSKLTASGMQPDEQTAMDAINVIYSTQESLKGKQKDLEKSRDTLERGLEAYLKQQEEKAVLEAFKGFVQISVQIGVAVYTSGAGAPLAAGTLKDVLANLDNAVKTLDRVKVIFKKLAESLPPLIDGLRGVFTSWQKAQTRVDTVNKSLVLSDQAKELATHVAELSDTTVDFFGLMAQWEDFKIDIETLFNDIEKMVGTESTINGLADYKAELRKMAIRGLNVLEAQRIAQDRIHQYYRGRADQAARKQAEKEVLLMKDVVDKADSNALPDELLVLLEDQLASAKVQVFTGFYDALLSYAYRSGSTLWPSNIKVTTDTSGISYKSQCAELMRLQNAADEKYHNLQTMDHAVTFDTTNDASVFSPDWPTFLSSDRTILFRIPPDHQMIKDWYHTRVQNVSVSFEIGEDHQPNVPYYITLGPHFVDQGAAEGTILRYTIEPYSLQKTGDTGTWDQAGLYILPPVSCSGSVMVTDAKFDVSNVTKVLISFTCKGIRRKPQ